MGLFDDITTALYCPFCGYQQEGWQTKDFPEPYLNKYSLGDAERIIFQTAEKEMRSASIEIHKNCTKCDRWFSVHLSTFPYMGGRIVWEENEGKRSWRVISETVAEYRERMGLPPLEV